MGLFLICLCCTFGELFWICDVLDMPFMKIFDTTYPLNEEFYLLTILLTGGITEEIINYFARSNKR